uniref:Uncharacterized protein n=1 Tax=Aegilops tauschii subsp. strangulata TaxID=200361 RepID=A0A452YHZ8_AEGTS
MGHVINSLGVAIVVLLVFSSSCCLIISLSCNEPLVSCSSINHS